MPRLGERCKKCTTKLTPSTVYFFDGGRHVKCRQCALAADRRARPRVGRAKGRAQGGAARPARRPARKIGRPRKLDMRIGHPCSHCGRVLTRDRVYFMGAGYVVCKVLQQERRARSRERGEKRATWSQAGAPSPAVRSAVVFACAAERPSWRGWRAVTVAYDGLRAEPVRRESRETFATAAEARAAAGKQQARLLRRMRIA